MVVREFLNYPLSSYMDKNSLFWWSVNMILLLFYRIEPESRSDCRLCPQHYSYIDRSGIRVDFTIHVERPSKAPSPPNLTFRFRIMEYSKMCPPNLDQGMIDQSI